MSELDTKMRRLQDARKKAEDVSKRRQRIAGELDGHLKRLAELEKKCRDDYGCEVAELPGLSAKLEKEAERAIIEAERLLTVPAASASASAAETVKAAPVKPAEPLKVPRRSTISPPEEDVL
jgi:DNA repair ATPase RecN